MRWTCWVFGVLGDYEARAEGVTYAEACEAYERARRYGFFEVIIQDSHCVGWPVRASHVDGYSRGNFPSEETSHGD